MFNSGIRGRRARDGEGSLQIADVFIQKNNPFVTISRYSILDGSGNAIDDLALDTAGGQTVLVVGGGFETGVTVTVGGTAVSPVVRLDSTRLTFTSPAKTSGSQALVVNNVNGSSAIFVPGLAYSGTPTFVTTAGTLGTVYETTAISTTISATSDSAITYTLDSGTLPPGSTLSSSGLLSGTAPADAASTTYTFTVRATDAELQESTRQFSITVSTDVVSWQDPEDQDIVVIDDLEPNIVLDAVSAAGSSISYTASALPTGLSLSNGVITGTVSVEEDTAATLTATADTTTRSAAISVTWRVSLGDSFFKNTTLLLNGDATAWISDASPNGFNITPSGDARPSAFSPYNTNWSNFFDGTGDYLRGGSSMLGSASISTFTIDGWVYPTVFGSSRFLIGDMNPTQNTNDIAVEISSSGQVILYWYDNNIKRCTSTNTMILNAWNYFAIRVSSNSISIYVNSATASALSGTTTLTNRLGTTGLLTIGQFNNGSNFNGYASNLRVSTVARTISVPTANFTSDSDTRLLICQSNRFIDNSTNNFTLTISGDVKVTAFGPFTETDTETGSGYFDGTGDLIEVADNSALEPSNSDWCIEAWMYPTVTSDFYWLGKGDAASAGGSTFSFTRSSFAFYIGGSSYSFTTNSKIITNQWNHIVLCRNGTDAAVFINGERQSTTTGLTTSSLNNVSQALKIGGYTGSPTTGYISNFRYAIGDSVYDPTLTTLTIPSSPLNAISNTSLLTLQSRKGHNNNYFLDDSGNRFNITRTGNATQGTFSPFNPSGWSVYFDGTGDYLSLPSNSFNFGSNNFTIECWIYTSTAGSQIIGSHNQGVSASFLLTTESGNLIRFTWNNSIFVTTTGTYSLNAWNHIAVVRDSSTIRIYINGVQQGSGSISVAINTNTLPITIGGDNDGSGSLFTGYISNLRVLNGICLYQNGTTFTPSTIPLPPVANTSLLTCRANNFIDEGPNRFTITRVGDSRITPFSPFKSHTITPNSYSFYFDGNNDYLTLSASSAYDLGTQNFTFECWIHPSSSSGVNINILTMQQASGTSFFQWFVQRSGSNFAQQYGINNVGNYGMGSFNIPADRWAHVALTREGNTLRAYTNGTLVYTNTNFTYSMGSSTTNHFVGVDTGANNDWLGYISNFRIVKGTAIAPPAGGPTAPLTAVSGTSVLTCQSPTVVDNSGNGLGITVNGNTSPSQFNPFGETVTSDVQYSPTTHGGSLLLDGSGDYLTIPPNSQLAFGTGDFTIEFWLSSTVFSRDPYDRRILRCISNPSTGAGAGFGIALNGDPTTGIGQLGGGTEGFGATGLTTSGTVCNSGWHHIVLGRKSSILYLFHNGILQGSTSNSNNITDPSTYNVYVGWFGTAQGFFNGYLHGVKLIKGSFVYPTSNFVPPSAVTSFNSSIALNFTNDGIQDSTGRNVLETVGDAKLVSESPYSLNKSVYFDGSGDSLTLTSSNSLNFGTGDFTIEVWVNQISLTNPPQAGSQQIIVMSEASNRSSFYILTDGRLAFTKVGVADVNLNNLSSTRVRANMWNHIAFTRSGTTMYGFINGGLVGSATRSDLIGSSTGTVQLFIDSSVNNGFYGYASNLRVIKGTALYTSAFTPSTSPLTAVSGTSLLTCQSYNFKDNSANNFTITKNGDAKITSRGPFTETLPYVRSMSFDGTGDWITNNNFINPDLIIASGNFTVEGWIYTGSPSSNRGIVQISPTSGGFHTVNSPPSLAVYVSSSVFGAYIAGGFRSGTTTVSSNVWTHFALVRVGQETKLYVNGVIDSGFGTVADAENYTGGYIVIGGYFNSSQVWSGYIDDLRITKGIARYTANFTPSSSPFKTR